MQNDPHIIDNTPHYWKNSTFWQNPHIMIDLFYDHYHDIITMHNHDSPHFDNPPTFWLFSRSFPHIRIQNPVLYPIPYYRPHILPDCPHTVFPTFWWITYNHRFCLTLPTFPISSAPVQWQSIITSSTICKYVGCSETERLKCGGTGKSDYQAVGNRMNTQMWGVCKYSARMHLAPVIDRLKAALDYDLTNWTVWLFSHGACIPGAIIIIA